MAARILYVNPFPDCRVETMTLAGVRRYAGVRGWAVEAVRSEALAAGRLPALLRTIRPVGCIVECSGGRAPLAQVRFGRIPVVFCNGAKIRGGSRVACVTVDDAAAADAGFNAIDTARSYGGAEESIARWLKASPGNRDRIVLLTKCCDVLDGGKRVVVTAERIRREVDESLKTLGTDHVDVLLLHRDDPAHPVAEYIETLEALRREGKCLAYGGSNWRHERIAEANAYAAAHGCQGMSISSPHYGLAEQVQDPFGGGCVTVTGAGESAARAWYRETRMPLLAYSSLGRGFFSGRFKSSDIEGAKRMLDEFARRGYLCDANLKRLARAEEIAAAHGVPVATVAMAYLLTDAMNTLAVASMSSARRILENREVFDFQFTPGERESLAKI